MQIPLCHFSAPLLFYGFSQITDLMRKPAGFYWPHFIPAMATAPIVLAANLLNAPAFAALGPGSLPQDLRVLPAFFLVHLLGLGSNVYILFFISRVSSTAYASSGTRTSRRSRSCGSSSSSSSACISSTSSS